MNARIVAAAVHSAFDTRTIRVAMATMCSRCLLSYVLTVECVSLSTRIWSLGICYEEKEVLESQQPPQGFGTSTTLHIWVDWEYIQIYSARLVCKSFVMRMDWNGWKKLQWRPRRRDMNAWRGRGDNLIVFVVTLGSNVCWWFCFYDSICRLHAITYLEHQTTKWRRRSLCYLRFSWSIRLVMAIWCLQPSSMLQLASCVACNFFFSFFITCVVNFCSISRAIWISHLSIFFASEDIRISKHSQSDWTASPRPFNKRIIF